MSKTQIAAALAVGVVAIAVIYLMKPAPDQAASPEATAAPRKIRHEDAPSQAAPPAQATQPAPATAQPVPEDPRLAALMASPDNGLIEFVRAPDGNVIAEIDKDPSSLGFNKPSREYTYSGGKVIALTSYRYMSDQIEIARTRVSYKPDGSVDQYDQSIRYERATSR